MPHLIEITIILLFLIGMVVVGLIINKKVEDLDDYLVGGRNVPTWAITGSLFATFWGGGTVLGSAGAAYHGGILETIADPFAAGLALVLIGIFFVSPIRRLKLNSVSELYLIRYSDGVSIFASFLMLPTFTLWTAVQIIAIGKVMNILLGLSYTLSIIIGALVIVAYTYLGGLLAVVWTETIQMFIILLGLFILLPISIKHAGGFGEMSNFTPEGFWSFIPRGENLVGWLTYISAWAGMALGNIPSPDIAQRAFSSKDEKTARDGSIYAGILYWIIGFIPILFSLVAITMVGKGMIPGEIFTQDSEMVIPYLAKTLLSPIGLGIFVGSLMATVMSSASSSIFASAVILSNDIYKYSKELKGNNIGDEKALKVTKICVLIIGVLSLAVSFYAESLYDLMVFSFTILFNCLFFPFIFAFIWKRANAYGALSGMAVGFLITLAGCIIERTFVPEPEWFFTLVPAFANFLAMVTVSLATQRKNPPKALATKDGEIIKWGDLRTQ